uniref:hypothetical protein n=1 Tax=Synechococcus sp. CS-1329 TaxID=2847975 RepID=UPI00223C37FB|nr:hypothetical protein [Synechococcus sp. CS-1329]
MKAVILAGGIEARISMETQLKSKPMTDIVTFDRANTPTELHQQKNLEPSEAQFGSLALERSRVGGRG